MGKITRRQLIKRGMATVGAMLLASCASPTPTPEPKPTEAATASVPEPTTEPTQASTEPITLRVLYYGGNGSLHYDEFSKRYSDESNGRITVELEIAPGNEMVTKQETGLATGTLADLVRGDTSFWPYLAKRGAWLVIDDLVEKAGMDLSGWFNIEWFRKWTDGKLSGLGGESGINHNLVLYNKTWVLEAWGKEPTEDWTIEDYTECMTACVKAKGGKGSGYFGSNAPIGGNHVCDGYIRNWGGQYISDDGTKELFAEEKCQAGIQWIMEQIANGNFPTRADLAGDGEYKMFYAGKIAMIAFGPGGMGSTMQAALDAGLDVGWTMFPKGPSAFEDPPRRAFIPFSNPLSIYTKTKYPEETFGLLQRITSLEAHKWITLEVGRQPGAQLASWYDEEVAALYPWFPKTADWMKTCTDVFPCPANARFPEWADLGTQEIPRLVYGDIPYTKENVQMINDKLQEILDLPVPETLAK